MRSTREAEEECKYNFKEGYVEPQAQSAEVGVVGGQQQQYACDIAPPAKNGQGLT